MILKCTIVNTGACGVLGDHAGTIPVCLPQELNRYIATADQKAKIDTMSDAPNGDFAQAITDYANSTVKLQLAALYAVDQKGNPCGCVNNGLLQPGTKCVIDKFARDPYCEKPENFAIVNCVPDSCQSPLKNGMIDPHACTCNTTVNGHDNCDLATTTVFIPPAGSGDPPGDTSGILAHEISAANSVEFDQSASSATASFSFDDHLGVSHSDSETAHLSGGATLYGIQRADKSADLLFELAFAGDDITFHFKNVDVVANVDVTLSRIVISGSMGDLYVHFDSTGMGFIPQGALFVSSQATVRGQKVVVQKVNEAPIRVQIDFQNKKFSIPSLSDTFPGGLKVEQPPGER